MSERLYEDMRAHPSLAPVFDDLALAQGADEFERALALVRDCFSVDKTLRVLSRKKLSGLMKARRAVVFAYEQAVVKAAQELGEDPKDFGQALRMLPAEQVDTLHRIFEQQMNELMGR